MPRDPRGSQPRVSNIKLPEKFFILAVEGAKTEPEYFNALEIKNKNLKIKVLERLGAAINSSSPKQVLKQLNDYKQTCNYDKNLDELWMVVDRDRWGDCLSDAHAACIKAEFNIAVSAPCIELWFLLHVVDVSEYTEEEKKLISGNAARYTKKKLKYEIRNSALFPSTDNGYSDRNPNTKRFMPYAKTAIERAKELDREGGNYPKYLGTHVYKLIEKLLSDDIS